MIKRQKFFQKIVGASLQESNQFEFKFLHPLYAMRKIRQELIKSALAGLDESDDKKAKELLGDLIDDESIIQADVMSTLEDQMNGLYSIIIDGRNKELDGIHSDVDKELLALIVMNLFILRDKE